MKSNLAKLSIFLATQERKTGGALVTFFNVFLLFDMTTVLGYQGAFL